MVEMFVKRIAELEDLVAPYSEGKLKSKRAWFSWLDVGVDSNSTYLAVIIVVFLLLAFTKPSIVANDFIENNKMYRKLSLGKFFASWVILSGILCAGIFAYRYQKKSA